MRLHDCLGDAQDPQPLDQALEASVRAKERLDAATSTAERRGLAMHYVSSLLRVVQATVGAEVLSLVYGEDVLDGAGRQDQLLQLASRTRIAAHLFDTVADPAARTSLDILAQELRAIGNGAEPQLVAALPAARGAKRQEYRKAEYKFQALGWEQVLLRLGDTEKEARETVEDIFALGKLSDWRRELTDRFGSEHIYSLLELARSGVLSEFADVPDRASALDRIRAHKEAAIAKLRSAAR